MAENVKNTVCVEILMTAALEDRNLSRTTAFRRKRDPNATIAAFVIDPRMVWVPGMRSQHDVGRYCCRTWFRLCKDGTIRMEDKLKCKTRVRVLLREVLTGAEQTTDVVHRYRVDSQIAARLSDERM